MDNSEPGETRNVWTGYYVVHLSKTLVLKPSSGRQKLKPKPVSFSFKPNVEDDVLESNGNNNEFMSACNCRHSNLVKACRFLTWAMLQVLNIDGRLSEKFASCFSLVRFSCNKHKSRHSVSASLADFGYKRTYSRLNLLESAGKGLTFGVHCFNNPSRRYSSHCDSLKFSSGETYSILQSSSLQHWFKNWQGLRKHKLTASTFAGAIGFWPHRRVQLWLEKIGAIEPFSGNLATCWSNIKEEEALERYKLITGNTVLFPNFQVYGNKNPEADWLAASPDGLVDRLVYDLPSRGVLEIKCPFFGGDMTRASPWKRMPCYCIPQAQGLMEILDRDWMDFYVWTPNGSSLFRLYRDLEYWDVLNIALSDFWWKHVQPARELCCNSVISEPLKQLRHLKPAPRHELWRDIVCESKRIVDNSNLLMCEIHGNLQN